MLSDLIALGRALRLILTAAILGLVVAIFAAGFVSTIASVISWSAENMRAVPLFSGIEFHWRFLPSLSIAALLILLNKKISKAARWHGPADSILAAHHPQGGLEVKEGYASTLTAFFSAIGGASIGQYGPLVHFGATVAVSMRRVLGKMPHDIMIGCGVAAAISAGFHAPIAGVIFAHEAVMRHFSIRALGPVVAASVTAASVSAIVMPGESLLAVKGIAAPALHMALIPSLISGLIFGLSAVLFMNSLRFFIGKGAKLPLSAGTKLMFGVLLMTLIGGFFPQAMGFGTSTVADSFAGNINLKLLLILFAAKILLTSLSLSSGFFGGVFSPAIFTGAMMGCALGQIFELIGIDGLGAALTLAGMAAVAASVIGAPLATIMITLELTHSYEFALIALISVSAASVSTQILFGHSFFDRQLLDRGIDMALGRSQLHLTQMPLKPLAHDTYLKIHDLSTPQPIIDAMVRAEVTESYLVDDKGCFQGKFILPQLLALPQNCAPEDMLCNEPLVLKAEHSVAEAMNLARDFVGESIPVVDKDWVLCGVISEGDLFHAYESAQTKARLIERD